MERKDSRSLSGLRAQTEQDGHKQTLFASSEKNHAPPSRDQAQKTGLVSVEQRALFLMEKENEADSQSERGPSRHGHC